MDVGERVKLLDGVAVGDVRQAAEASTLECPPDGADVVAVLLERLPAAHEVIINAVTRWKLCR